MRVRPVTTAVLTAAAIVLTGCSAPSPVSDPSARPAPAPALPATADLLDDGGPSTPATAQIGPPELVVTVGDSIMAGLGVDPDAAWPALLADSSGANILNLGCSGAGFLAVGDCGEDFDGLIDEAITLRPDLVIVQSSDNDLGVAQADIADTTRSAIDRLHAALPDALIVGIGTLWQLTWDQPAAISWSSAALRNAVTADGGVFVSLGQPLRDHPELLQWDGEHPNEAGQQVLSDAVASALSRAGVLL